MACFGKFDLLSTLASHHYSSASLLPMAGPKPAAKAAPSRSVQSITKSLWNSYEERTSTRLKFIDAYLLFIMLSGILQFVYCILVTDFPFNAFLAG
jgi:oligosaccharyltransferase complex subunit epsilon